MFYKKAVIKNFSIFTGKYLCSSLFLIKLRTLRSSDLQKKRFQHKCFSVNIAKFLKKLILKKICERLLLLWLCSEYCKAKLFIHEDCKISVKCFSTFAGNTSTRVSFLIVAACNLSLSLFKKRFSHWCFTDSYLNFLTTTFLKREKEHCFKKNSIVMRKKSTALRNVDQIPIVNDNYATFYVTSPRFLYFSTVHSDNRLHLVLSVEKSHWK